jgi:hypothetical protein
MAASGTAHVTRFAAEVVTALCTLALASAVVIGALEYGTGWSDAGPEPGTFPYYVGVLVAAASLGNLVQAWRRRREGGVFLDARRARRVAAFGVPLLLYVAASVLLGFYVASALYVGAVMRFQGGYRWIAAIGMALSTSAFFFLVLEWWFKVPMLKGPLEAALGLH